jgi:hypothetical protein
MSATSVRLWIRALRFAAVLAIGLATGAAPAATPAEAAVPDLRPDLQVTSTPIVTESISGGQLVHQFKISANGTVPVGPGKAQAIVNFPIGVTVIPSRISVSGSGNWSCRVLGRAVLCTNGGELRSGFGPDKFTVGVQVDAPKTVSITSEADFANTISELNEGNNKATTVYHFVP